jgi:hypothetical protein
MVSEKVVVRSLNLIYAFECSKISKVPSDTRSKGLGVRNWGISPIPLQSYFVIAGHSLLLNFPICDI